MYSVQRPKEAPWKKETPGPTREEERLRAEHEKYKKILEGIEDGYFEVDIAGNFSFFNTAMRKILGYSRDELMGMNNRQFMDEVNAKKVFNTFNTVYRTGIPTKAFDWELIRKNGEKRIVETSVSLQKGENGNITGFMGIARDITKSKLMEVALKKSEESYRLLLESLPDPVVLYNMNAKVVYVNPSFENTFGWSNKTLAGNRIDFVPEANRPETIRAIKSVLRGEKVKLFDTKRLTRGGELLDIQLSTSGYLDKEGNTSGIVAVLRDVSEIKRTKEDLHKTHSQLKKAYEDLKVLDRTKEKVINHLSHELQTPIAILVSAFDLLAKKLQKQGICGFDSIIKRGRRYVERLKRINSEMDDIFRYKQNGEEHKRFDLIEDVLSILEELKQKGVHQSDFAYQVLEKLRSIYKVDTIKKEEIVIDKFLNQICDIGASSMHRRQLEIKRDFKEGTVVSSYKKILAKIFSGLLKNAIENTPDGGKIEVYHGIENGEAIIRFRDYGVGILEENQRLIFSGFYHTQDTADYCSKNPYEFNAGGSGSDLLRIKIFSEVHGFSIGFSSVRCKYLPTEMDSCPGKISLCRFVKDKEECFRSGGSEFVVRLPIDGVGMAGPKCM
ncbi:MAG: PAS domain S-box protein [Deltaproteobacteria bacterium]|nr:PAS domain S-box protein [Deltaproteobacteria bacterium]